MEKETTEKNLITTNHVVINGITLDDEQATLLFEAMNGHLNMGAQYEEYMEEERGISVDEQFDLIHSIFNLFRQ